MNEQRKATWVWRISTEPAYDGPGQTMRVVIEGTIPPGAGDLGTLSRMIHKLHALVSEEV